MVVSVEHILMVAVAGLLEGLGVPWPGAIVVAAAGLAAGGRYPDLFFLTALFGVAYSIGSLGQYGLGRFAGTRALAWMPRRYRTRLDQMLAKYGLAAVFFSRPLAIGNYISAPAGAMRMPLARFLPSTFFGVAPWALGMLVAGDSVAAVFSGTQQFMAQNLVPIAVAAVLLTVGTALWKRYRRTRTGPVQV